MILYTGSYVTFQEVPDEVSLTLTISNCQGSCPGCHSPWLREDIGDDLERDLPGLLDHYGNAITCVCFMGEGNDPKALMRCIELVKDFGLKTALYSGEDLERVHPDSWFVKKYGCYLYNQLDYLKVGSYMSEYGSLNCFTTNQRMFEIAKIATTPFGDSAFGVTDITYKFQKKKEIE